MKLRQASGHLHRYIVFWEGWDSVVNTASSVASIHIDVMLFTYITAYLHICIGNIQKHWGCIVRICSSQFPFTRVGWRMMFFTAEHWCCSAVSIQWTQGGALVLLFTLQFFSCVGACHRPASCSNMQAQWLKLQRELLKLHPELI